MPTTFYFFSLKSPLYEIHMFQACMDFRLQSPSKKQLRCTQDKSSGLTKFLNKTVESFLSF